MLLDRYITKKVLTTAIVTMFIFIALLLVVELFTKIDQIMDNEITYLTLIKYSILGLPDYLSMVISISFLFAVTYTLSQFQANNEFIALYNAGLPFRRIIKPIYILAIFVTLISFLFLETVGINAKIDKRVMSDEIFGMSSTTDNTNIALKDFEKEFIIHARSFSESNNRLYSPVVIQSKDNKIVKRIEADTAEYINDTWIFKNGRVYETKETTLENSFFTEYPLPEFTIEPRLFRNFSATIDVMELPIAYEYIQVLQATGNANYNEVATEFYNRVFSHLTIFLLMVIACHMNYSLKKNVLIFSIAQSVAVAVIYYVANMLTQIMGKQGVISPLVSIVIPFIAVIALLVLTKLFKKRK